MNFTELALHEEVQKGIESAGYIICTPVQEQVLLRTKDGADLYVQSQTGTGKTAAYLIAVIQQMLVNPDAAGKKALIMAPTRELAVQIEEEAKTLLQHSTLKPASFYGGVGYTKQHSQLKKGVDILIGTPGRVIDLQESGVMDLSTVGFLVVDEADRMFDMGFYPDLRTLIKMLPGAKKRQTMLFSATLNTYVKNLAWEYTEEAEEITIESQQIAVSEISQQLIHVASADKMRLLIGILQREQPESAIIFCNTKKMTEVAAKRLKHNGFETEFIVGDLPQSKRLQVMESFKRGSLRCLTATDVAARGIDVNDLELVVNFDLPNEAENYVHRIGRTARAGKSGKAYSFCSEQDVYNLPAIEKYMEISIPSIVASDDMLGEDKSTGTYIITGLYNDDDERHDRGARRNDRRGEHDGGPKRGAPRGGHDSRYESASKNAKPQLKGIKPHRNDAYRPPTRSTVEERDLSKLSFDERMKIYRKKYAGSESVKSHDEKSYNKKNTASSGGQKTQRQHKNHVGAKPPYQKAQAQKTSVKQEKSAAQEKKAGFFSRLTSFFAGKK